MEYRFPHSGIKIVDKLFLFNPPLNSMKKSILIVYMSLQGFLCLAQDQNLTAGLPEEAVSIRDTSIITDLVSSIRENSKVILNWARNKNSRIDFITVERSNSGSEFEVVAVIKQSAVKIENEWIDEAPPKGRNLYRLRYAGSDGQAVYTNVIAALIAGDTSFKFYPNPVDNILIIRTDSALDVQILDAAGKVRVSQSGVQGLQTINVSALEKGLYFLRINNRITGSMTQEKLLKN